MRQLYTLLFYLALPGLFVRLWWLGRRHPGYRQHWQQRLGFAPILPDTAQRLWLHAVSVGEVQAAVPLIRALQQRDPSLHVLVTTTTATGAQHARQQLGDSITHSYLPYDIPAVLRCFIQRVNPAIVIIMETELWPNLLYACRLASIPVILANARLSERSLRRYRLLADFSRTILAQINTIAAQTAADAARFIQLGASPERVKLTGNIKFDIALPPDLVEHCTNLRQHLGQTRPIWIAASTHAGEEEIILAAMRELLSHHPTLLLILAPRHPERAAQIRALCRQQGLSLHQRIGEHLPTPHTQVFLLDTIGELLLFYGAADIAFVGGSLIPHGGHNPLEPASLGIPVLTGPYVHNFQAVYQLLAEAGALTLLHGPEELMPATAVLLANSARCRELGRRGRQVIDSNRGALPRLIDTIVHYLG